MPVTEEQQRPAALDGITLRHTEYGTAHSDAAARPGRARRGAPDLAVSTALHAKF
ncbi:hypothetical protein [Actinomadura kijaniata]|uniref:hypothetical protein n=1 Tax=Actinomadura kijaniata TaxID=46161 RepID=UPI001C3F2797|nr:hypothetical protein [Actinomadura kijaniata]